MAARSPERDLSAAMRSPCGCPTHGTHSAATPATSPFPSPSHAFSVDPVHATLDTLDGARDLEDAGSSEDDDEDPGTCSDDTDDGVDHDDDIARSTRWRFLTQRFARWFQSVQYSDHRASTAIDLRFESFYVFLPDDTTQLQKLREATELVALMLQLDKNAWWFLRTIQKPGFAAFFPSNYDPVTLVPTMTFVLHDPMGSGDDTPGAVTRLQHMLVDGNHRSRSFVTSKRRILDVCDPEQRLRGFRIPIAFQLRPAQARSPQQLRAYLQDVITLVDAVQAQSDCASSSYTFHLHAITLSLYLEHVSDAHAELVQLLSLGVPVTLRLRHPHRHIAEPFAWSDFGWRANVFPVVAVGNLRGMRTLHTLVSRAIHSSVELLSAVACSTSLAALKIEMEMDDEDAEPDEVDHATWLAYALRRNTTLRSLELHHFQGTHARLDAMMKVRDASDPARLLSSTTESDSLIETNRDGPQWVHLTPDALIATPESHCPQSFAQLNVSPDTALAVVRATAETIEFVVPGHAVCSAPTTSIASLRPDDPLDLDTDQPHSHWLDTLVLTDAYCERGVLPRFVDLVGRSLRELRWADSLGSGDLDQDLAAITTTCPHLTRLYLQGASLHTLTPPTIGSHSHWLRPSLRELSLMHTAVSSDALVAFFQSLQHDATSLERFSYYCPGYAVDARAADAALQMLTSNRRLQSLSLGIQNDLYDQYEGAFQDARDHEIQVEKLPLATKHAFCSVVRQNGAEGSNAIGRLDRACLTQIFQWFSRFTYRRVRVVRSP